MLNLVIKLVGLSYFINISLPAHSCFFIGAPATLNVEPTNVTMLPNQLILEASNGRGKIFKLHLFFTSFISPLDSKYESASVGRLVFTLKKAQSPSKWGKLMNNTQFLLNSEGEVLVPETPYTPPNKVHIWLEIKEKYESLINDLPTLSEGDSDKESSKVIKSHTDASINNGKNSFESTKPKQITKAQKSSQKLPQHKQQRNDEDNDDDDDEETKEPEEIISLRASYYGEMKLFETQTQAKKEELDLTMRETKRQLDTELNDKKRDIRARMKLAVDTKLKELQEKATAMEQQQPNGGIEAGVIDEANEDEL
jgi:hypothetical protein